MLNDLRYALRSFKAGPGLTLVAALSLALGIGANSAIFSVVDARYFRPLAVRDPGRVVRVFTSTDRNPHGDMSYADFTDMRSAPSFADLIAVQRRGPLLTVDGLTETTQSHIVTDNYFTVLGVDAALGRVFTAQSARQERPVVISHRLWQRKFGGDPGILGKPVLLNSRSFVLIGVAPKSFRGTELWTDPDLWTPMGTWNEMSPGELDRRNNRWFDVLGRLKAGATIEQARSEVSAIAQRLAAAYPKTNGGCGAVVLTTLQYQLLNAGTAGAVMAGIVAIILLIACANVANLLIARGEARRREIAIRLALGCGRGRLVRQFFLESLLLALLGAGLALLLAAWLIEAWPALLPSEGYEYRLDHRVLLFTLASAVLSALLFGMAPALRASRPDLVPALKEQPLGRRGRRIALRDGLVVAQVALSLVLLVAVGLLVRSFIAGLHADLGFERKNMLAVRMYPEMRGEQARVFLSQLSERARALPGVRNVSLTSRPPFWPSEGGMSIAVNVLGQTPARVKYVEVGENYFRTMGVPLLRGRDFDSRDNAAGQPGTIINETMARRFWPNDDPIGRIVRIGSKTDRQVVGIVKDTKINSFDEIPEPFLYLPMAQAYRGTATLLVETEGDPLLLVNAVKAEIAALAKLPVPEFDTLGSLVARSLSGSRSLAEVVGGLGLLGLLLAAGGLYGVMSYLVTLRSREIGVRTTLGAVRRDILKLVLTRAAKLSTAGGVIGLIAALAAGRLLSRLLYGVSPRDPISLISACAVLFAVAMLAGLKPALRASRIDPMDVLRQE